jgi:RimJ/RimL family protein N-acetyltransferase
LPNLVAAEPVIVLQPYEVFEMQFTLEKAKWLWNEMNKYRTLWNDFTRGDFNSWFAILTAKDSFWLEVQKDGEIVGIIYWTDMVQIVDAQAHCMFFDRDLANKVEICQRVIWWFFTNFPECHRMTATIPSIFHATSRLLKRIGFREEGRKRQSLLMKGNRIDQMIFGLLASEVL